MMSQSLCSFLIVMILDILFCGIIFLLFIFDFHVASFPLFVYLWLLSILIMIIQFFYSLFAF